MLRSIEVNWSFSLWDKTVSISSKLTRGCNQDLLPEACVSSRAFPGEIVPQNTIKFQRNFDFNDLSGTPKITASRKYCDLKLSAQSTDRQQNV